MLSCRYTLDDEQGKYYCIECAAPGASNTEGAHPPPRRATETPAPLPSGPPVPPPAQTSAPSSAGPPTPPPAEQPVEEPPLLLPTEPPVEEAPLLTPAKPPVEEPPSLLQAEPSVEEPPWLPPAEPPVEEPPLLALAEPSVEEPPSLLQAEPPVAEPHVEGGLTLEEECLRKLQVKPPPPRTRIHPFLALSPAPSSYLFCTVRRVVSHHEWHACEAYPCGDRGCQDLHQVHRHRLHRCNGACPERE